MTSCARAAVPTPASRDYFYVPEPIFTHDATPAPALYAAAASVATPLFAASEPSDLILRPSTDLALQYTPPLPFCELIRQPEAMVAMLRAVLATMSLVGIVSAVAILAILIIITVMVIVNVILVRKSKALRRVQIVALFCVGMSVATPWLTPILDGGLHDPQHIAARRIGIAGALLALVLLCRKTDFSSCKLLADFLESPRLRPRLPEPAVQSPARARKNPFVPSPLTPPTVVLYILVGLAIFRAAKQPIAAVDLTVPATLLRLVHTVSWRTVTVPDFIRLLKEPADRVLFAVPNLKLCTLVLAAVFVPVVEPCLLVVLYRLSEEGILRETRANSLAMNQAGLDIHETRETHAGLRVRTAWTTLWHILLGSQHPASAVAAESLPIPARSKIALGIKTTKTDNGKKPVYTITPFESALAQPEDVDGAQVHPSEKKESSTSNQSSPIYAPIAPSESAPVQPEDVDVAEAHLSEKEEPSSSNKLGPTAGDPVAHHGDPAPALNIPESDAPSSAPLDVPAFPTVVEPALEEDELVLEQHLEKVNAAEGPERSDVAHARDHLSQKEDSRVVAERALPAHEPDEADDGPAQLCKKDATAVAADGEEDGTDGEKEHLSNKEEPAVTVPEDVQDVQADDEEAHLSNKEEPAVELAVDVQDDEPEGAKVEDARAHLGEQDAARVVLPEEIQDEEPEPAKVEDARAHLYEQEAARVSLPVETGADLEEVNEAEESEKPVHVEEEALPAHVNEDDAGVFEYAEDAVAPAPAAAADEELQFDDDVAINDAARAQAGEADAGGHVSTACPIALEENVVEERPETEHEVDALDEVMPADAVVRDAVDPPGIALPELDDDELHEAGAIDDGADAPTTVIAEQSVLDEHEENAVVEREDEPAEAIVLDTGRADDAVDGTDAYDGNDEQTVDADAGAMERELDAAAVPLPECDEEELDDGGEGCTAELRMEDDHEPVEIPAEPVSDATAAPGPGCDDADESVTEDKGAVPPLAAKGDVEATQVDVGREDAVEREAIRNYDPADEGILGGAAHAEVWQNAGSSESKAQRPSSPPPSSPLPVMPERSQQSSEPPVVKNWAQAAAEDSNVGSDEVVDARGEHVIAPPPSPPPPPATWSPAAAAWPARPRTTPGAGPSNQPATSPAMPRSPGTPPRATPEHSQVEHGPNAQYLDNDPGGEGLKANANRHPRKSPRGGVKNKKRKVNRAEAEIANAASSSAVADDSDVGADKVADARGEHVVLHSPPPPAALSPTTHWAHVAAAGPSRPRTTPGAGPSNRPASSRSPAAAAAAALAVAAAAAAAAATSAGSSNMKARRMGDQGVVSLPASKRDVAAARVDANQDDTIEPAAIGSDYEPLDAPVDAGANEDTIGGVAHAEPGQHAGSSEIESHPPSSSSSSSPSSQEGTPLPVTPTQSQGSVGPTVVVQASAGQNDDQSEDDEPEAPTGKKKKTRRSGRKWKRRIENNLAAQASADAA